MADDTPRDDEQQPEEVGAHTDEVGGSAEPPAAEEPQEAPAAEEAAPAEETPVAEVEEVEDELVEETPRVKPAIPGADLEVDLVFEGEDRRSEYDEDSEDDDEAAAAVDEDLVEDTPISTATIDLAAGARSRATGKRKTAVARVILKPGTGAYLINGKPLDDFFPRATLQRNIRQPLETVGYEDRMDVVARMHGGGVSSQAGALRHGISKALLEADPNLRTELKKRGFLTRDARVKERKKAGLKKARKRPQFSKR
jgi:small subunit ribosomal protein S9